MNNDVVLIDKKFVRKVEDKNVSICNLRRSLPREIGKELFENVILASEEISEEHKSFLLNYYKKRIRKSGEVYLLHNIPVKIPSTIAKEFSEILSIDNDKQSFLSDYYDFKKEEEKFVLKEEKYIDEEIEIQISKVLKLNGLHISNSQRTKLSEILEKVNHPDMEQIRENIFYANLYVHPEHDYFIDPFVKHYSGMHILEAAREMPITATHVFGNLPLSGITFTLKNIHGEFFQYASLNKPIKLKMTLNELKIKDGCWNAWDAQIDVFQDTNLVAITKIASQILPMSTYKLVREDREDYDILPRFRPLEKYAKNISLRTKDKKYLSSVENISTEGFQLRFIGTPPDTSPEGFEFFMHFDGVGIIHGSCELVWLKPDRNTEDQFLAGFKITDISKLDKDNLKESINRFSYLLEERQRSSPLRSLKCVFLHFDGAVMQNILGPIFYNMVKRWKGEHSAIAEEGFFSKSRGEVEKFVINHFGLKITPNDVLETYYMERAEYLKDNEVVSHDGLEDFLDLLKSLNLKIIAYGGASRDYFDEHIEQFESYFDDEKYIQTNTMLPGIKEMLEKFNLKPSEALFIDEENYVSQVARKYDTAFIGIPSNFEFSFQKEEMEKSQVKYIVESLKEINISLLKKIDNELEEGTLWD
ncbi:MAG: AfsA-related hotdog domain-containing protein [Spirochaetota bacterium]